MKAFLSKYYPYLIFVVVIFYFFSPTIFSGLIPIPADTIVGLNYPYKDIYHKTNPNGVPFKNFLITDPVRQTYPWKKLLIDSYRSGQLPVWNPYEMAGKPLLANFQSSPFYILNIILFIQPFYIGWTFFIVLQTILGLVFMYWYLTNLKISKLPAVFGSCIFTFSGFSVAWFEWGTIIHTLLWLPLILLSLDKVLERIKNYELRIMKREIITWSLIYVFSLCSSLFAGHLQTFFYIYLLSLGYFALRWFEYKKELRVFVLFIILNSIFIILTSVQWFPTLQFIVLSARNSDQLFNPSQWLMPWKHLIQIIVPDFFGNPTTLNYWGTWNYGEMVGYVGVIPLFFTLYSSFSKFTRNTIFFIGTILLTALFILPTPIAFIPFAFHIPFLETSQPTRLLSIFCFAVAVLSALGLEKVLQDQSRNYYSMRKAGFIVLGICSVGILLWGFIYLGHNYFPFIPLENITTSYRNLLLPTGLVGILVLAVVLLRIVKNKKVRYGLLIVLVLVASYDLMRFAHKFESFSKSEYLYPSNQTIHFLEEQPGIFRVAAIQPELLHPNLLTYHKIESVSGYDPLYLLSYGEFITAMERNEPNIKPPFGFSRIIIPRNYSSPLFQLLNVKYILSIDEIKNEKLQKVHEYGRTKIYKNANTLPRAFFVDTVQVLKTKQQQIEALFTVDLSKIAIIEGVTPINNLGKAADSSVTMSSYSQNSISLTTYNTYESFLVVTNVYYPTWSASIDSHATKLYKTDYTFQGLFVPAGSHTIELKVEVL